MEQPCETSVRTWSPGANDNSVPPACTEPLGCYLQLEFSYPVVPQTLTIWVTFITTETHTIRAEVDVRILLVSGEILHLGPQKIFCDVPLTIKLNFMKVEMYGIQIHTKDNLMEIDAAMITSVPNCPLCAKCNSIHYKVLRDPPFEDGSPFRISGHHRRFLDT